MNFQTYYDHYLSLHQNLWCRRLHVLGQIITILFTIMVIVKKAWFFLVFAPFIIYPFAWSGHIFFEKNKPAAFSDPIKAKISDWFMLYQWLKGDIER